MLQCYCDYEPHPGELMWDFSRRGVRPIDRKRATRCADCGDRIEPGDDALAIRRWKIPAHDVECKIYGEEDFHGPPRATHYLCDQCGVLFLGLTRIIKDCCWHYTETRDAADDYHQMMRGEGGKHE